MKRVWPWALCAAAAGPLLGIFGRWNWFLDLFSHFLPQQTVLLDSLVRSHACLRSAVGTIARRNSCRNPWTNQLDLRISKRFRTVRGQDIELVADLFNFLNFLNGEWGRVWTVAGAGGGSNGNLVAKRGFNSVQNRFVYEVNPTFGKPEPSAFRFDQFQAQFGVRYNF